MVGEHFEGYFSRMAKNDLKLSNNDGEKKVYQNNCMMKYPKIRFNQEKYSELRPFLGNQVEWVP